MFTYIGLFPSFPLTQDLSGWFCLMLEAQLRAAPEQWLRAEGSPFQTWGHRWAGRTESIPIHEQQWQVERWRLVGCPGLLDEIKESEDFSDWIILSKALIFCHENCLARPMSKLKMGLGRIPPVWYDTMHSFFDEYRCSAPYLQD